MPVLPSLNLYRHDRGDHTTITMAGEIDLETAPALPMMVGDCLREGIRTIDIDLTALAFCDVSGFNALLDAARRTASAGGSLRLLHPRPHTSRLLHLSGLGFLLHTECPAPTSSLPSGAVVPVRPGRRAS
jgi:anti-anti-sigma factor